MFVIIGGIVVIGSVLGGFTIAGGSIGALIHPSELLTIGGAALGAAIIMSPAKVMKDLIMGMIQTLKGSPYSKKAYNELFMAMYEIFKIVRQNGMLALEEVLADPHKSPVFSKYPTLAGNHHATEYICSSLSVIVDNSVSPEKLPELMEQELKSMEEEHHAAIGVLAKTADGMPGFGIVAAVLGIVITMAHIDGPVEEIGHMVGAALVGTFLGILISYGFLAPLAVQMEFLGQAETGYFKTIAALVQGLANNTPPKAAIEQARRGVNSGVRPVQAELEAALKALG